MDPRRRTGMAALLAAAFTLVVAGCTSDEAAPPDPDPTTSATTAAPTTPAPPPPPRADACYRLAPDALAEAHNAAAPVACGRRHNTQTYRIGNLDAVADTTDAAAVAQEADDQCRRALRRHVDATPARLALSRVTYAWFVPTEDELAAGARWIRCDVAVERTGTTLLRLPDDTGGLLSSDDALDRYGSCARTGQAGIAAGRGGRVCALPHTWRAVSADRLGSADDAFPGRTTVAGDVLERCETAARDFTGNATGDIDVGWLPPTRAQWQAGERFGTCWTRTND